MMMRPFRTQLAAMRPRQPRQTGGVMGAMNAMKPSPAAPMVKPAAPAQALSSGPVAKPTRLPQEESGMPQPGPQFYAAGGYVTKAKTLNTPACAKGKKRK